MSKYKVYFEIFGKKMVTVVEANSMTEAQEAVRNKIIFHKTQIEEPDIVSELMKIFGFK